MKVDEFDTFYEYMEYRLNRRVHAMEKRVRRTLHKYGKTFSNSPDEEDRRSCDPR